MRSNVNIVNHPVHPILVLIPAGAWITSFILDIIFLATGSGFWFVASFWVMIIGIGGALLAAITGLLDLFSLPITDEPRKVGIEHMTLNTIILILYIINAAAIRAPSMTSPISAPLVSSAAAGWGFVLNLISVLLLLVSGWLGGELIYRFGLAVPKETMDHASRYEILPGRGRTDLTGSLGGESPEDLE